MRKLILLHGVKRGWLDYELTVEHVEWFGLRRYVQVYRGGMGIWTLYPQGYSYWGGASDWLDAQCQQFEWSQDSQARAGQV